MIGFPICRLKRHRFALAFVVKKSIVVVAVMYGHESDRHIRRKPPDEVPNRRSQTTKNVVEVASAGSWRPSPFKSNALPRSTKDVPKHVVEIRPAEPAPARRQSTPENRKANLVVLGSFFGVGENRVGFADLF